MMKIKRNDRDEDYLRLCEPCAESWPLVVREVNAVPPELEPRWLRHVAAEAAREEREERERAEEQERAWAQWWEVDETPEPEKLVCAYRGCEEEFVPKNRKHLFHGLVCKRKAAYERRYGRPWDETMAREEATENLGYRSHGEELYE
jgi:hypothetical protein